MKPVPIRSATRRTILFFGLFFAAAVSLRAQIGLNLRYQSPISGEWVLQNTTDQAGGLSPLRNGYEIGLDYWLYLQGIRVEFLPELAFQQFFYESLPGIDLSSLGLGFYLNTNIYLLDLQGDCGCPTFSKQGNFFSKGFFLQLSPGVVYQRFAIDGSALENRLASGDFAFSLGAALGLDIGLSDRFTLTPFGGIRYLPSLQRESLGEMEAAGLPWRPEETNVNLLLWQAGLRMGFRYR